MATQRGVLKIVGKLDDIVFYEKDGKMYARKAANLSAERIKSDPAFARTRENMSQFAGMALAGKSFRDAFTQVVHQLGDKVTHRRVMQLMSAIMKQSAAAGDRGQLPIEVLANKDQLIGFEFNSIDALRRYLNVPFSLTSTAARNEATLIVPDFDTGLLRGPTEATHFKLVLAIGTMSDHTYDLAQRKYVVADAAANGKGAVVRSAPIQLGGLVGAPVTLNALLDGSPTIPAGVALIAAVGIEFIQMPGTKESLLKDNKALSIREVF